MIFRWMRAKRKRKRDGAKLALYRDWPPMVVDEFLDFEQRRQVGEESPAGYVVWRFGFSYQSWKQDQSLRSVERVFRADDIRFVYGEDSLLAQMLKARTR